MGLTSLQVCMDTSEWLQGAVHEENGLDHSSSPSGGDIISACSRPAMLERRLRPPHDHALKCPRCDSAHTKFCYYNNYSLSQPRYFCKTCRRYWTKGGSLRNIPVGGGCRKNSKRVASSGSSSKKSTPTSSSNDHLHQTLNQLSSVNSSSNNDTTTTDLHLSFPHDHHLQLSSHFSTLFGNSSSGGVELGNLSSFMENKYNALLDNPIRQVDFMECTKYDNIVGNPSSSSMNNHDFMSNSGEPTSDEHLGNLLAGLGNHHHHDHNNGFNTNSSNFNGLNPFGNHNDSESSSLMMMNNSCQRLMQQLPFDRNHQESSDGIMNQHHVSGYDVKPDKHLLSLDQWHVHNNSSNQQGCSEVLGKDSFGYNNFNSLGSWSGAAAAMLNGYGSSHQQANPLV